MAQRITGGSRRPRVVTEGGNRVDDNQPTPEQITEERRRREEAESIQLLSAISLGKKAKIAIDAAKAVLKEKQDAFSDIARNAKTAIKIPRAMFVQLIDDSDAKDRMKVQTDERNRARWRRAMGLPVGISDEQLELEERLPDTERNGMFWRAAGYTAGLTGGFCDPPAECVGGGFDNLFAEGHKDGHAAYNKNTKLLQPKPAKAAAPKSDPLDDPHSPESLRRDAGSVSRAKASLEAMGSKDGEVRGDQVVRPDGTGGEEFTEATPEELAAQAGRAPAEESGEPEAVG